VKRFAFNLVCAGSLLLFATVIGLCFVSYKRAVVVQHRSLSRPLPTRTVVGHWTVGVSWGSLMYASDVNTVDYATPTEADEQAQLSSARPSPRFDSIEAVPMVLIRPNVRDIGVARYVITDRPSRSDRIVLVPCWLAALTCAILPAVWVDRRRRQRNALRRLAAGLCPKCGYDLRESPGRCPECGTPAEQGINGNTAIAS
jgi:hypothetical protein